MRRLYIGLFVACLPLLVFAQDDTLQKENLLLKRQLNAATARLEICSGQLAPHTYQANEQTLAKAEAELGYVYDATTGILKKLETTEKK